MCLRSAKLEKITTLPLVDVTDSKLAYDRINQQGDKVVMVKCKILPATRKTLRVYLGSSVDQMFEDQSYDKTEVTSLKKLSINE